ncbi:MAG TPA: succinylglutamate desuccinylase/aspartoacylase family protein, partial [Candidatus Acidoferrales bacterium]|nr:succinylglutamate desuccinylase/aspartoacylase family protein [Candidatus Acidoferrales bacterium]
MRKILAGIVLAGWVSCVSVAAQHAAFKLNGAEVPVGQKTTGVLEVPAGVDGATQIPIAVIRGAKPGPTLTIVSGSHGTEYASIIAVERLISEINPAQVSGTVVLVPLVNHASFQQKVPHVNPVDGKSMNRFYPGKTDGTQTERASYVMTHQVVDQADYLIDLHGGDLDESLRPYSYWTPVGNEKVDAEAKDLVLAFGLNYIIIQNDFPRDPNASRYLSNTAMTRGKPAVTAEAGYSG